MTHAKNYGRFIPREEIDTFSSWQPSTFGGAPQAAPEAPPDPATQLAAVRAQGYQDGYRDGLAALEQFKQSHALQLSSQIGALLHTVAAQLDALQQQMAESLVASATQLARQVVRSEITARPDLVAQVAHEAVEALLLSARHVTLRVNPQDHALVELGAAEVLGARGARLVADEAVARGGCIVDSDIGSIDATVPTRWARAAASIGSEAAWSEAGGMNTSPIEARALATTTNWQRFLGNLRNFSGESVALEVQGRLQRVAGLVLEASGLRMPVGSVCEIHAGTPGHLPVRAEVVGFSGDRAFLMPTGDVHGLASGARVVLRPAPVVPLKLGAAAHPWRRGEDRTLHLPVGDGLLGRVVDSHGHPLDRRGPVGQVHNEPLIRRPINAMDRDPVRKPLDTGVRAINAMLTVGRGQRIGLFAGTGVGKSVLMGMMARYTSADVIVVGLIGERGREVKEFIEDILGPEGLARSVVVAAPADAPPLVRLQGAHYATAVAEHFRDRGMNVLLLMDSLTRYAMAQREIALAIGEPPATKGYPPSSFAKLPQLVERSGNGVAGGGSITAFYTVLSEGDDTNDPVADAARGILDGHIVLSRELAEAGHYPAIDVERSISRVMTNVADAGHVEAARRFRQLHARRNKARDLIAIGAYQPGHDAELDLAVRLGAPMNALLQQDMHERATLAESIGRLRASIST